ncbi:MAG: hypothetical protein JSS11_11470, partial [Verrucomicrobia bacterium]|nr:hypothetical protein [Verrucomicrobiota bacterium]
FIAQERPELADVDIPVPVRIERGSWIADIPDHAGTLIATGFGVVALSYLKKAAEKMAEKDFSDVGIKDVLLRSLKCIQWFIAVSKHLGHTNIRRATLVWDKTDFVGFLNDARQIIYVPVSYFKTLAATPVTLLSEAAGVVEAERKMVVAISENGQIHEVEVTKQERAIFADEEADDEILFPELVHGQMVDIDGVVTRGNEMTNTLGFWHRNHVLTCRPRKGSIVKHKKHLFLTCRLSGEITRLDKKGNPTELRPKIIFDSLESLPDREQISLPLTTDENDEG